MTDESGHSEPELNPRLWTDYDGTVVELLRWYHPDNWIKGKRIPGLVGFKEFLQASRERGIEVGGVISARPNNVQRRMATRRSIVHLGLDEFFHRRNVLLVGSNAAKAEVIADEATKKPIGMLEDKPERLVPLTVKILARLAVPQIGPVTFGISPGNFTPAKIQSMKLNLERSHHSYVGESEDGYEIESQTLEGTPFRVNVVPLREYSAQAGHDFAQILKDKAYQGY